MIKWDSIDYVALSAYTEYRDRFYLIEKELSRVGVLDRVHVHWDYPSVFTEEQESHINLSPYGMKYKGTFAIAKSVYGILKTAYCLGSKNVLLMQDDIRFLKRLDLLEEAVTNIPTDADLVMLDCARPLSTSEMQLGWKKYHENLDYSKVKFIPFDFLTSEGCYIMSRKAMERYTKCVENIVRNGKPLEASDRYLSHKWLGEDLKFYFALPNVAVQGICGQNGSHCSIEAYWRQKNEVGVRQEWYNLDCQIVTPENFLSLLYQNCGCENELNIGEGYVIGGNRKNIKAAFSEYSFKTKLAGEYKASFIWGNSTEHDNIIALQVALRDKLPILLCEDGFIRSVDTWCGLTQERFRESFSVIVDKNAYYFDAMRTSDVETMINDCNLLISKENLSEAHRLIDKIVSNKISKYNHQPIFSPKIGRDGVRKVLVVDQSYGDFSIKRGMADDSTFEKMLQAAITENPDADILVKTHPDTLAGKKAEKKGYYQDLKEHDNIYKVTFPINPYSLMEICDKVYVCSSQFGLEALMAGKEVHVFGMPFYAGWGLTIDDLHLERRTNKRTLEELFYIFYCMYTHWVDPDKGCETTIDAVIDKMIKLREEYQKNPHAATRVALAPSISDDGFGYVRRSPSVRTPFVPQPNPPISSRSSIKVLPRIGSTKRGYSNW